MRVLYLFSRSTLKTSLDSNNGYRNILFSHLTLFIFLWTVDGIEITGFKVPVASNVFYATRTEYGRSSSSCCRPGKRCRRQSDTSPLIVLIFQAPFYAVHPKADCPHVESNVAPLPEIGLEASTPCFICQDSGENWVCLKCYKV